MAAMVVRRLDSVDEARSLLGRFKSDVDADPGEFLTDRRTFLFMAEEDGEPVGWAYAYELIRPDGRREMMVYEIDVAPGAQRRGHGRALIEALIQTARERGHIEMWTLTDSANESAAAVYTATGGELLPDQAMYTWSLA